MKVTLTHDGKSVELDLTNEQLTALGLKEEKKMTGYERCGSIPFYCTVEGTGRVHTACDANTTFDDKNFDTANYYSDKKLAEANARADSLMRQLRRFAAENDGIPSMEDWKNKRIIKHTFVYDYANHTIKIDHNWEWHYCGVVYFLSAEARDKAITKFHDELIWYFTEYEAMLR